MTRPNAGTRQLAINLQPAEYDRLAQAAAKSGISMTLATRIAINQFTARRLGAYQPPAAPAKCAGSGLEWWSNDDKARCPGCHKTWGQLGLARRPNRKTTRVPVHTLDITPADT